MGCFSQDQKHLKGNHIKILYVDFSTCQDKSFPPNLSRRQAGQKHNISGVLYERVHMLNLVMSDVTGEVIQSITLFSLLNDLAIFFKQS